MNISLDDYRMRIGCYRGALAGLRPKKINMFDMLPNLLNFVSHRGKGDPKCDDVRKNTQKTV